MAFQGGGQSPIPTNGTKLHCLKHSNVYPTGKEINNYYLKLVNKTKGNQLNTMQRVAGAHTTSIRPGLVGHRLQGAVDRLGFYS